MKLSRRGICNIYTKTICYWWEADQSEFEEAIKDARFNDDGLRPLRGHFTFWKGAQSVASKNFTTGEMWVITYKENPSQEEVEEVWKEVADSERRRGVRA